MIGQRVRHLCGRGDINKLPRRLREGVSSGFWILWVCGCNGYVDSAVGGSSEARRARAKWDQIIRLVSSNTLVYYL